MGEHNMLALDMGASNGRVIYGSLSGGVIRFEEIHRFENEPVMVGGALYWDILRLFHEIKHGLLKCKEKGLRYESIGLCSWGNTVGLLDKHGDLIMNPYHYRDTNPNEVLSELYSRVSPEEMFRETGYRPMTIQPTVFLNFLKESKAELLDSTQTVLMISDLFNYMMTGVKASERTMAATSQMVNMDTGEWDRNYMKRLGIKAGLFPEIVENGTVLGMLAKSIADELGLGYQPDVIAVSGHDTAAASGCIDSGNKEESLYLSCGTWSCMGCRVDKPIRESSLYDNGITNDMGLYSGIHLRSNHTGLWILQECRREWVKKGRVYSWMEISDMAQNAKSFLASIDTEAETFFLRDNMPKKVKAYCETTGQSIPQTDGEVAKVVLESLAFRYRFARDKMASSAGCKFTALHMLGGGSKNRLLCQYTSNVLGTVVKAGPTEATTLGNFIQQAIAGRKITSFEDGQKVIRSSEEIVEYRPEDTLLWDKKYKEALSIYKW